MLRLYFQSLNSAPQHLFPALRDMASWNNWHAYLKSIGAFLRVNPFAYSIRQFEYMSDGLGYHKVLCDDVGNPTDFIFLEVNPVLERMIGLKRESIIGKKVTDVLPGIEKESNGWIGQFGKVALTGEPKSFESYTGLLKKWHRISAYSVRKGYFAATFEDISDRKRVEQEKESLVRSLQNELAKIKQLQGLLPICACCKKIRDSKGCWNHIEAYIERHSEVEFTHGFCPECLKTVYGFSIDKRAARLQKR